MSTTSTNGPHPSPKRQNTLATMGLEIEDLINQIVKLTREARKLIGSYRLADGDPSVYLQKLRGTVPVGKVELYREIVDYLKQSQRPKTRQELFDDLYGVALFGDEESALESLRTSLSINVGLGRFKEPEYKKGKRGTPMDSLVGLPHWPDEMFKKAPK